MVEIRTNRVLTGVGGRIYFCPRVRVLGDGLFKVLGKKVELESTFHELIEAALTKAVDEGLSVEVRVKEKKPKRRAVKP